MSTEIERKFLVGWIPEGIEGCPSKPIRQGYLIAAEGIELRVRQKANRFFQTIKTGEGVLRKEIEIEITRSQFDQLWPHTKGCRVSKIRYQVPADKDTAELDLFDGDLTGLRLVEVEFSSLDASRKFSVPEWFGKEVTEDKRYKNKRLAQHGTPED